MEVSSVKITSRLDGQLVYSLTRQSPFKICRTSHSDLFLSIPGAIHPGGYAFRRVIMEEYCGHEFNNSE